MPTKLPRLNVVLDPAVYKVLQKLAKREKLSLSLIARDLIKEAVQIYEDGYWAGEADKRLKSFSMKRTLSHEKAWS